MLAIDSASDFGQFRAALADCGVPPRSHLRLRRRSGQHRGDLGRVLPAGPARRPVAAAAGDRRRRRGRRHPVCGRPQAYDPGAHVIATANQRPVGRPTRITSARPANFFDAGYRADAELYALPARALGRWGRPASLPLQGDHRRPAWRPRSCRSCWPCCAQAPGSLSGPERTAMNLLARLERHDDDRLGGRVALVDVLGRLHFRGVPAVVDVGARPGREGPRGPGAVLVADQPDRGPGRLDSRPVPPAAGSPGPGSPGSGSAAPAGAFGLPSGAHRTAAQVMRAAFGVAVAHLAAKLGGTPGGWTWARLHTRYFPSVSGAAGPGLRAARVQRRRLDGGRGRGGPAVQHRPELADDRGLLRLRLRLRLRVRRRPFAGGRRLPGRPEREPGVPLVRQPDRRLVGQPLSADGVYRERGRGSCPLVPAASRGRDGGGQGRPQGRCGDWP